MKGEAAKPCPFCGHGGDEIVVQTTYKPYFVMCRNCGARVEERNVREILRKWNQRAGERRDGI